MNDNGSPPTTERQAHFVNDLVVDEILPPYLRGILDDMLSRGVAPAAIGVLLAAAHQGVQVDVSPSIVSLACRAYVERQAAKGGGQ